jgi:hypothetical protein
MLPFKEETFSVHGIEVIQKEITSIDNIHAKYNGLHPSSTTLPKGHKKDPSRRGFQVTTVWDRDVEMPMRDGVVLRADVFRPADIDEKVPALLVWSPYGKSGTGFLSLDLVPGRVGVPESALSGFESFEAPDPAEWTAYGYAVVNVDARGIMKSGGNHRSDIVPTRCVIRWLICVGGTGPPREGTDMIPSNTSPSCPGATVALP